MLQSLITQRIKAFLNIISNNNLTQFLEVAKVNNSTYNYNKANITDKTWFSGVQM